MFKCRKYLLPQDGSGYSRQVNRTLKGHEGAPWSLARRIHFESLAKAHSALANDELSPSSDGLGFRVCSDLV